MGINPSEYELMILVKDIHSAPEIYTDGKLITKKIHVNYKYETSSEIHLSGKHQYDVKHLDAEEGAESAIRQFGHMNLAAHIKEVEE
jgi:hypothetical protein